MYERTLNLPDLLEKKSFFLFGPRSTGKTTLIQHQLKNAKVFDLLDMDVFRDLLRRPKLIEEKTSPGEIVVIDEIQKLPILLDEVHRLIEKRKQRFLMTGSSARKLKHGSANLLAGRAWRADLFPLTFAEIKSFDLIKYLNLGGLPHIYDSPYPEEELRAYINVYLREEIQSEGLTRNLPAFSDFLDVIALANGEEINLHSLASDCGVSPNTLKNYIKILEDTLIGISLPAFTKTKKRKAVSRAKHYFFDIGIVNSLCNRGEIKPKSELFGKAFEHFVIQEVRARLSYNRSFETMTYWRSTSKFEVDLIIGNKLAVEIKATELVQDKHLKGLRAFKEEGLIKEYMVVSLDKEPRRTNDGIHIMPYTSFFELPILNNI